VKGGRSIGKGWFRNTKIYKIFYEKGSDYSGPFIHKEIELAVKREEFVSSWMRSKNTKNPLV
jgi:hypothetical protein